MKLKTHPFFIGALFQPALDSAKGIPNPIIPAFLIPAPRMQFETGFVYFIISIVAGGVIVLLNNFIANPVCK
jgi:hypothetical protein